MIVYDACAWWEKKRNMIVFKKVKKFASQMYKINRKKKVEKIIIVSLTLPGLFQRSC